jgi:hypothetical protein
MRLSVFVPAAAAMVASLIAIPCQADVPSALDELTTGYGLKQAGKCPEAIPHFLASYRADPKPKALLNLADCEAQVGELVSARGHAAEGRDLALQGSDAELAGVANEQLAAIDKRLPRLTVRLAPGAPAGSVAVRDGSVLSGAQLGAPVPLNPGLLHVVVTAPGYAEREFTVTLAEGASAELEVQPGPLVTANALSGEIERASDRDEHAGSSSRQILTYGAFGLGAAAIVVGVATGIAAGSKHSALENECTGNNCPASAQSDLDGFHSLRTASTVGYIVGVAALVGGATLWLTAPNKSNSAAAAAGIWIAPSSTGVTGGF